MRVKDFFVQNGETLLGVEMCFSVLGRKGGEPWVPGEAECVCVCVRVAIKEVICGGAA